LIQKGPKKSSQQKGFFALGAFALQIRQNLGCNLFAVTPYHLQTLYAKICYALSPLQAHIVLPDFGRSLSVDGMF